MKQMQRTPEMMQQGITTLKGPILSENYCEKKLVIADQTRQYFSEGNGRTHQVWHYTSENTRAIHNGEEVKCHALTRNMFLDSVGLCIEEGHV